MRIRAMTPDDAKSVLHIFQEGLDTGHANFASQAPDWAGFDAGKLEQPRLVLEDDAGSVVGWAALSAVSSRCVYGGVAEVALYVATRARGQGAGRELLNGLVAASEHAGIWTLRALVFPENARSIALHERCGFEQIGVHKRLGKMGHGPLSGQWRDVLALERRSEVVGVS